MAKKLGDQYIVPTVVAPMQEGGLKRYGQHTPGKVSKYVSSFFI